MTTINEMGQRAKAASDVLAKLSTATKNHALRAMAEALTQNTDAILKANQKDVDTARNRGMKEALIDRLVLSPSRIAKMAQCLNEIAGLSDPIGQIVKTWTRPNGLIIGQLRVPLGVVGMIYESRPDVTSDAAGICLKAGNAVILRGGSDAINSNTEIGTLLKDAAATAGIPSDAIQVVTTPDRQAAEELMRLREYVDVLIPRGGAGLIRAVVETSTVPVIETGIGNCHIYVEEDAELDETVNIIINAKCQRPGTCNSAEKILIHRNVAQTFLPDIVSHLQKAGVEIRACERTRIIIPNLKAASEADWYEEYLDLIIGIKIVDNLEDAIVHINEFGSHHSDAILTASFNKALRFIQEVDSAAVYWNSSTRFTDGNQYGLGAEIGISTQKIHARGPMSVEHLTTIKYFILGRGHTRK
ncbi:MAG: glutamate-5-semialdehyde dehydrogenase [Candidatus Bathyarchaeota archaeon]|nr:MAG: glutamate-5-semialdehyde dehydrogenase [Candidatus Bathyarchaeota archaeon]